MLSSPYSIPGGTLWHAPPTWWVTAVTWELASPWMLRHPVTQQT